ncbi:membrane protein [Desulfofustis phage LS06-2018-MD01]|nr:membrane protein [Desulfofustis phage LS06-2018-MD01]
MTNLIFIIGLIIFLTGINSISTLIGILLILLSIFMDGAKDE